MAFNSCRLHVTIFSSVSDVIISCRDGADDLSVHLSFALPPSGRLYGVRLQRSYCAGLSATLEFRLQHRRFVEVRLLLSIPDIGLTQSAKSAIDLHIDPFALG